MASHPDWRPTTICLSHTLFQIPNAAVETAVVAPLLVCQSLRNRHNGTKRPIQSRRRGPTIDGAAVDAFGAELRLPIDAGTAADTAGTSGTLIAKLDKIPSPAPSRETVTTVPCLTPDHMAGDGAEP